MAARTARTYLNEGLATLAEMNIPPRSLKPFHTVYLMHKNLLCPAGSEMLELSLREGQGDVEGCPLCCFLFPKRWESFLSGKLWILIFVINSAWAYWTRLGEEGRGHWHSAPGLKTNLLVSDPSISV